MHCRKSFARCRIALQKDEDRHAGHPGTYAGHPGFCWSSARACAASHLLHAVETHGCGCGCGRAAAPSAVRVLASLSRFGRLSRLGQ
jgi:hypothetical protein